MSAFIQYLDHRVLSGHIRHIMLRPLPPDVVDHHELQQRHVDEEHAHTVPNVHGVQIRDHREGAAKTIGCCKKVQHGGHSDHDSGGHCVPLQPERYEGTGH